MGRRSQILMAQESAGADSRHVIQVVSRAFDIVRCFEGQGSRLGNREIADRCGLPRSTVSRLTLTLTQIGQLIYLPHEQKYALGPHAAAPGAPLLAQDRPGCADAPASGTVPRVDSFQDRRGAMQAPLAMAPHR